MGTITRQAIVRTGLEASYAAADVAGDVVANDGDSIIHIKNGDGSDHTLTVASVAAATPGLVQTDVAVVVTAGEERFVGPFPAGAFNTSGQLALSYDAVTSVTLAVLQFDKAS